ncbi:divisome protein SepX/GlpR [Corynebacterium aurimucosum]|uniref:divisome protein SepX/GlpR n=1 Tax=Corynebacterium aurimucosum TaxID=169292 RepID=UPI00288C0A34|nr:gephyrin-like molybdotransferase receptor GlpR [uncultured Corynebacterium sp.]
MMTAVPIILVIVLWLFILAPLLLRSQRPMSHTGEAFEETRVLFEGDSGSVPGRRKPRLGKEDIRMSSQAEAQAGAEEADYELVEAEGVSEDSQSGPVETAATDAAAQPDVADTIDGEVVESEDAEEDFELAAEPEHDAEKEHDLDNDIESVEANAAEVFTAPANASVAEDAYGLDDSYTSPVDLMYPGAIDSLGQTPEDSNAEETDGADDAPEPEETTAVDGESIDVAETNSADAKTNGSDTELSAEELAFAQRRLGRGGWDPVKEKEASATRYQRRQRTLIGLAVAVVATVCLGIVVGGWTWWLAGIAGVATAVYLVALRAQVRREQELLRRRVYHLRRARLGVRNAENPAESLPPNLRRPGALILEIDDESPDFDYLPVYSEDDSDGGFDGPHPSPRQRRDDLAARRVG